MSLTTDRPHVPDFENEIEQLKDRLAERILHHADRAEVSEIEASIRQMWAEMSDERDWVAA
jgi:hypothetical protein